MPDDLVEVLRRVRTVEAAAETPDQRRRARAASAALFAEVYAAGWSSGAIAQAVGLTPTGVRFRIKRLRKRGAAAPSGVSVPRRPPAWPFGLDPHEWLKARDARAFVGGISRKTLVQWRRAGMLPNTRQVNPGNLRYSRADLERIQAAPRYNNQGVSRKSVLAAIDDNHEQG